MLCAALRAVLCSQYPLKNVRFYDDSGDAWTAPVPQDQRFQVGHAGCVCGAVFAVLRCACGHHEDISTSSAAVVVAGQGEEEGDGNS